MTTVETIRESIDPALNYALKHITATEHISVNETFDELSFNELMFIRKHLKHDVIHYATALKSIRALARNSKDYSTRRNSQVLEYNMKQLAREAHVVHCLFRGTPLSKIESEHTVNALDIMAIKDYIEVVYKRCIADHEKYMASWTPSRLKMNPTEYAELEEFAPVYEEYVDDDDFSMQFEHEGSDKFEYAN